MASLNFKNAFNNGDCNQMVILTSNEIYKGYYCDPKLDRSTMPEGWHAYDIRTDDDGCGIFCEICHNYVMVNNGGTFFTKTDIPELSEPDSYKPFRIDQEEWNSLHSDDDTEEIENDPDAWNYSFECWEDNTLDDVIEDDKPEMVEGVIFMTDEEAAEYKKTLNV
jgi:hypothetical protein